VTATERTGTVTTNRAILEGVRVLDLSRVLAAPWCTQALADMGATVWKIERPRIGDEMRHSPPFLHDAAGRPTTDSVAYVCVNRGKRSITVDFTRPEGQALLRGLAARADVLVENFKVGDLARYGLDYDSIRAIRPDIVYCSVTGYGQDGPMAAQPGYDPVFQAISGIMSTSGLPEGEPGSVPLRAMVPFVDVMTGMVATSSILGALYHRRATGEGQRLDIALLDVAVAASIYVGQKYLSTGELPRRVGNGSLLFAPSNVYPCEDGHLLVQIGNDMQWERLCRFLGVEAWMAEPAFASNANRVANAKSLDLRLSAITRGWRKQALADGLGAIGVPCGPVNSYAEAFEHPQVKHRGLVTEVDHPVHGPIPQLRSPLRFSATPVAHRPPPSLGADTDAVLAAELGLDAERIAALREARVL
jgi:crotonobetainyl-CoA:carnitine CoA-transferase CaiB-like acyl-CoA transferase